MYFEDCEVMVMAFVCVVLNVVIASIWSCTQQYNSGSMCYFSLLIAAGLCIRVGSSMMAQLSFNWDTQQVRVLSIVLGISAAVLCFFILQLPDAVLDFGLGKASTDFTVQINKYIGRHVAFNGSHIFLDFNGQNAFAHTELGVDYFEDLVTPATFQALLSIFAGFLTCILFFPALRLARCHHDLLRSHKTPFYTSLSMLSLLLPIIVIISYIKPLWRDAIVVLSSASLSSLDFSSEEVLTSHQEGLINFTEQSLQNGRFYLLVLICSLRLVLLRPYLQSFLDAAIPWAERLMSDVQRDTIGKRIQIKMMEIYAYVCFTAAQLLYPILLLLYFALLLKFYGELDLGFCSTLSALGCSFKIDVVLENIVSALPSNTFSSATSTGTLLHSPPTHNPATYHNPATLLLTPALLRSLFSFLCWWCTTSWFALSLVGLLFDQGSPPH
eukprot:TRINITY_DN3343_c0_g1_i3.p1 TRINITY_DN3343_c0_g1~~TRINITY_DN3343_c0_g1_i3.p1  ORF type:complete len:441 (-),score=40.12 TRINITY_DN3343_c0_g1_i3:217-1539(-)